MKSNIYLSILIFACFSQLKAQQKFENKNSEIKKIEVKKTDAKAIAAPIPKYYVNSNNSSIEITPDAISASRTTGSAGDNTALGFQALQLNQGNNGSTAVGYSTLNNSTTGEFNTALGSYALSTIQTKGKNTAIGNQALAQTSDGTTTLHGTENTAVGYEALKGNTTGYFNHAFGSGALKLNQTGIANVGIGTSALSTNNSGGGNIAIGHLAAQGKNLGSNYNVAIGSNTLQASGESNSNVAIGKSSQFSNTIGSSNTSVGHESLEDNSTGSGNIAVGYRAGRNETGSNKLYIANNATTPFLYGDLSSGKVAFNNQNPGNFFQIHNPSSASPNYIHLTNPTSGVTINDGLEIGMDGNTNSTYFWQNENSKIIIATNNQSSFIELASGASTKFGVGRTPTTNTLEVGGEASKSVAGSFIANSDQRLKKNIIPLNSENILNKILQMQGVNYEWNDTKTGYERPKGIQTGFIAQDLQKIWPEKIKKDAQDFLMTAYGDYDPMFVEAIKALNNKIERLEKENATLKKDKNLIEARIERLEKLIIEN
jgi:hypothetical protein